MSTASGIRAGAAYVELGVKDSRLIKGLDAAAKNLSAFGASITTIGAQIAALGAAAAVPLFALTQQAGSLADSYDKMSARTGISTEALSQLGFAAEQCGSNLAELELGLKSMQRAIALGAAGPGLAGLSGDQQFAILAQRIASIEDPARRTAEAIKIFGRSGNRLVPLLSEGAEGVARLRAEAAALGLTMSREAATAGAKYADAWNRMQRVLRSTWMAIGGALVPALTDLLDRILPVQLAVIDWVRANGSLVSSVAMVSAGLLTAGGALIALGISVSSLGVLVSTFASGLGLLGTLLGVVISPVGLLVSALVGLGAAWATMTDSGKTALATLSGRGKEALGTLAGGFQLLYAQFMEAWGGILQAIRAGRLELAFEIAAAAIVKVWYEAMLALRKAWNSTIDSFVKTIQANPWILPLIGAAAGGSVGAVLGPKGIVVGGAIGAGAGIGATLRAEELGDQLRVYTLAAEMRLADAQRRLEELLAQARTLPPRATPSGPPGKYPTAAELQATLQGARGSFNTPFAAQQLGLSDQVKKQEDLLNDLLGEVKQFKELVRGGLSFQ
jgi:hypothetical protein